MKVLVFPKDSNPYQSLLYKHMPMSTTVTYLSARNDGPFRAATYSLRLLYRLVQRRIQGYKILHIHWLYTLGVPSFIPFGGYIAYAQTKLFITFAKIVGYKIVWTAHNVLPHKAITSHDLKIRKKLAKQAVAIIAHSSSTITALEANGINVSKCQIIPHGNYIGVYQNTVTREQARAHLHIPKNAQVITFIGTIHKYKNVPKLIRAFDVLAKKNKHIYLLIAGRCMDNRVQGIVLSTKTIYGDRLRFYDGYVDDDGIQVYLNAADVCAFPFTEVTTSGSVLLATSFGKPVVAPYMGALKDMPKEIGNLYLETSLNGLVTALDSVINKPAALTAAARSSAAYSKTLSWMNISKSTLHVYEKAIA